MAMSVVTQGHPTLPVVDFVHMHSGLPHGCVETEMIVKERLKTRWNPVSLETESGLSPEPSDKDDTAVWRRRPEVETLREQGPGKDSDSHSPPPSCPVPWLQKRSWPVPRGCWGGRHLHR